MGGLFAKAISGVAHLKMGCGSRIQANSILRTYSPSSWGVPWRC